MVSFDRRYRALRRGYARERVKRDTEELVDLELDARRLRDSLNDDRGVASLIFGRGRPVGAERADRIHEVPPARPVAPRGVRIPMRTDPPAPTRASAPSAERLSWGGRLRQWVGRLFG